MAVVSAITPTLDRPTRSKSVTALDRQLPIVERADRIQVDAALVHRQRSMVAAVALCMQAAGLAEKEVYLPLGIDASHWTRITKGDAHFPLALRGPLMDLCGNDAPLEWLAHSRGYELRPLETETERLLRLQAERADKLEAENRLLRTLLLGRGQ
jgi:hypothetical protein